MLYDVDHILEDVKEVYDNEAEKLLLTRFDYAQAHVEKYGTSSLYYSAYETAKSHWDMAPKKMTERNKHRGMALDFLRLANLEGLELVPSWNEVLQKETVRGREIANSTVHLLLNHLADSGWTKLMEMYKEYRPTTMAAQVRFDNIKRDIDFITLPKMTDSARALTLLKDHQLKFPAEMLRTETAAKSPGKSPGKSKGKSPAKSPGKSPAKSPGRSKGKSGHVARGFPCRSIKN